MPITTRRRATLSLAAAAAAIPTPAFPAAETATADGFRFDKSKYAYVVITAETQNDVLNGACPDERAALVGGYTLKDLLDGSGDRSASVVVELDLPLDGFPNIKFDPISLKLNKSLFSTKCEFGFHRVDYASPLMSMAMHENGIIKVTIQAYKRRTLGGIFANTVEEVQTAAKRFAPIPGEALNLVGAVVTTLREIGDVQSKVFDTRDIRLSSGRDGKGTEVWTIKKFDPRMSQDIVMTARLMVTDHLFDPADNGAWVPSAILQRAWFVPDAAKPQTVESYLLTAAAAEYSTFNVASSASVAQGACPSLFLKIDRMGLTPRDNAILKWAVVRSHPNLGSQAEMDDLTCLSSVWTSLPTTSSGGTTTVPPEFKKREKKEYRSATYAEQSSLIEADDALALFFKFASWVDRGPFADRLFARPMTYADAGGTGLLRVANREMEAPSDWLTQQWDSNRALAKNLGCYSYRKAGNVDITEGQMFAIGNLMTGTDGAEKEALIRVTFDKIDKQAVEPTARIKAVEIISKPNAADLTAVKLRHPSGCGGGWLPALLR